MSIEIPFRKHLDFLKKFKVTEDGCWEWKQSKTTSGYGQCAARFEGKSSTSAHRVAYWLFKGSVPNEMQVHHTCHNPPCVNPAHLELVTRAENMQLLQQSEFGKCPQGHEYDSVDSEGTRRCSVCRKVANERYRAKNA